MRKQQLILFCLGLILAPFGLIYSHYWFVWPFVVASVTCVVAAAVAMATSAISRVAFWVADASCSCLLPAAWFAMDRWPGGDDGPGMMWSIFVCPISLVALLASLALPVQILRQRAGGRGAHRIRRASQPGAAADRASRGS